jgi:hypothetical protein
MRSSEFPTFTGFLPANMYFLHLYIVYDPIDVGRVNTELGRTLSKTFIRRATGFHGLGGDERRTFYRSCRPIPNCGLSQSPERNMEVISLPSISFFKREVPWSF